MAIAPTILFLNDYAHFSKPSASISALSFNAGTTTPAGTVTDSGYDPANVQDTNYWSAWKAPDNNAFDNALQYDFSSNTYLSSVDSNNCYIVLAYDASQADQISCNVKVDVADSPTGAFATNKGLFSFNKQGPTVAFIQVTSGTGFRYWRLLMTNAQRGGGTRMPKIYNWGFFPAGDILDGTNNGAFDLSAVYPGEVSGTGELMQFSRAGRIEGIGGAIFTNKNGPPGQEIDLTFEPANTAFWSDLRDFLFGLDVDGRAFYVQFEGLKNYHQNSFQMVRVKNQNWTSSRPYQNVYKTSIRLATESWGI